MYGSMFEKGAEGVGVRLDDRFAYKLPCELRLAPLREVENIAESLCITLGMHPSILMTHTIPDEANATLYVLSCTTLFQETAQLQPVELIRGDELVQHKRVTGQELTELASTIAWHLLQSEGSGSVIGGYQPETDTFTSIFATHFVQALTAHSLFQYALLQNVPHGDRSLQTALRVLDSIANDFQKTSRIDIDTAAFLVASFLPHKELFKPNIQNLLSECAQKIVFTTTNTTSNTFSHFTLSLLCAGTYTIGITEDNLTVLGVSKRLCETACSSKELDSMGSLLPWIVAPAVYFSNNGVDPCTVFLQSLYEFSASAQSNDSGLDTEGGFMFLSSSGKQVDGRSLRMIPTLVQLCAADNANASTLFEMLCNSIRYLEQLTTSESRSQRYTNPAMAVGGVRASTWDAAMPTEASAMALLGIVDSIKFIKALEGFAQ